jgi:hypothetical protein
MRTEYNLLQNLNYQTVEKKNSHFFIETSHSSFPPQITMPRRGPKTWTTPEEVFLQSQLPAYIACQATKFYHTFWNTMTHEFLSHWPERARLTDIPQDVELSDEQKSCVAQAILK